MDKPRNKLVVVGIAIIAVSFALTTTSCGNQSPQASGQVPVESAVFDYPQNLEELEAFANVSLSQRFSSARFELRSGHVLTAEEAAEMGVPRESVTSWSSGVVDFSAREFAATTRSESRDDEGQMVDGETFAQDHYLFYREPQTPGLPRRLVGPWFESTPQDFGLFFFSMVSSSDGRGIFGFDASNRQFENLGSELVRGVEAQHLRFRSTVETDDELWGGGDIVDVEGVVEVWVDSQGRPVRARTEYPYVGLAFLFEVDFWDFDQVAAVDLPENLHLDPEGKPYGKSGSEVTHSQLGSISFDPSTNPRAAFRGLADKLAALELEFALEPTDTHTRILRVRLIVADSADVVGVFEPANGAMPDSPASLSPNTFTVEVDAVPLLTQDPSVAAPVDTVVCPNAAMLGGRLEVLEAEIVESMGFFEIERLHVEFEHECLDGAETTTTSGSYRHNATS